MPTTMRPETKGPAASIARPVRVVAVAVVVVGLALIVAAWTYPSAFALPGPSARTVAYAPVMLVPWQALAVRGSRTPVLTPAQRAAIVAVDTARGPLLAALVVLLVVVLAAAAVGAWRLAPGSRLRRALARSLLVALSAPAAAYLASATTSGAVDPRQVEIAVIGWLAIVSAVCIAASVHYGVERVTAVLCLATAAVIVVDQWASGPLMLANVLGYSAIMSGRSYGLGNDTAGLLLMFVAGGLALLAPPGDSPRARSFALAGAAALGVSVVTCVSPWWGANVGVAAWGTVLVCVAWNGLRPTSWPRSVVIWVALALAVVIAGLVAADAVLGLTHVGVAVAAMFRSGGSVLIAEASRIFGASVSFARRNFWTAVIAAAFAAVTWLRLRPPRAVGDVLRARPAVRSMVSAAIAGSLVAMVVEDTGPAIVGSLAIVALGLIVVAVLESSAPPADDSLAADAGSTTDAGGAR